MKSYKTEIYVLDVVRLSAIYGEQLKYGKIENDCILNLDDEICYRDGEKARVLEINGSDYILESDGRFILTKDELLASKIKNLENNMKRTMEHDLIAQGYTQDEVRRILASRKAQNVNSEFDREDFKSWYSRQVKDEYKDVLDEDALESYESEYENTGNIELSKSITKSGNPVIYNSCKQKSRTKKLVQNKHLIKNDYYDDSFYDDSEIDDELEPIYKDWIKYAEELYAEEPDNFYGDNGDGELYWWIRDYGLNRDDYYRVEEYIKKRGMYPKQERMDKFLPPESIVVDGKIVPNPERIRNSRRANVKKPIKSELEEPTDEVEHMNTKADREWAEQRKLANARKPITNANTDGIKAQMEYTLESCRDFAADYGDDWDGSDAQAVKCVLDDVVRVKGRDGRIRGNIQEAIADWLMGLPMNIAFNNHDILQLGEKWGYLPKVDYNSGDYTRKEGQWVDNWFMGIANNILKLARKFKVETPMPSYR